MRTTESNQILEQERRRRRDWGGGRGNLNAVRRRERRTTTDSNQSRRREALAEMGAKSEEGEEGGRVFVCVAGGDYEVAQEIGNVAVGNEGMEGGWGMEEGD